MADKAKVQNAISSHETVFAQALFKQYNVVSFIKIASKVQCEAEIFDIFKLLKA